MGISSSMNAGVSGLNANANKLATISDNIANSQTYGYKRADIDFSSMTISDSKSPNTVGGGRWFTAGGVQTQAIWDVTDKGALTTTSNATDLAITGRGFLPVTDLAAVGSTSGETPFMLTTTGSFDTNAQGYLTTTSGLALLGWPADASGTVAEQARDTATALEPVRVNISSVAVQPTTEIALNVNLPTDDVEAGADGARADRDGRVLRQRRRLADADRELRADGSGRRRPAQQRMDADPDRPGDGPVGRHLHAGLQRHAAERRRPRQRHRAGRRHARQQLRRGDAAR